MLMTNLSILTRFSRIFCERKLNDMNIGFTEQSILKFLSDQDNVNQEMIAKHFMLDKGSIAKTLSKLEEKALINRTDNPNNKREKLITITELGKENSRSYQDEIRELHSFIMEGLTAEEINEFTRIIEIMAKNAIKAVQGRIDKNDSTE